MGTVLLDGNEHPRALYLWRITAVRGTERPPPISWHAILILHLREHPKLPEPFAENERGFQTGHHECWRQFEPMRTATAALLQDQNPNPQFARFRVKSHKKPGYGQKSLRRDSNSRPCPYQGHALPAEPLRRNAPPMLEVYPIKGYGRSGAETADERASTPPGIDCLQRRDAREHPLQRLHLDYGYDAAPVHRLHHRRKIDRPRPDRRMRVPHTVVVVQVEVRRRMIRKQSRQSFRFAWPTSSASPIPSMSGRSSQERRKK